MLRRDYILRMIEDFRRVLLSIGTHKQQGRWQEAGGALDKQFRSLLGVGPAVAVSWSETELSAKLIHGESTQFVREKALFLIRLFMEAGDAALAQDQTAQGHAFYVKGLNLLLGLSDSEELSYSPDLVPTVAAFAAALTDAALPPPTLAMMMRHFECTGELAKAEDSLYDLLEATGHAPEVVRLGIAFYHRLLEQADDSLSSGNLPRAEVQAGLAKLQQQEEALTSCPTRPSP